MDEEDSSSDSDVQELEGFQGFSDAEINNAAYRNSPPFLQRIGNRSTFFNRIVRSSDRSDSDSSPPVLNRENENYEDIPANHSSDRNAGDNRNAGIVGVGLGRVMPAESTNVSLLGVRLSQLDVYLLRTMGSDPSAHEHMTSIIRNRNSRNPSRPSEDSEDIPVSYGSDENDENENDNDNERDFFGFDEDDDESPLNPILPVLNQSVRTLINFLQRVNYSNPSMRIPRPNFLLNLEYEDYEDVPAMHSYLGDNLEAVSGRMIYTENRVVSIPIITGHFGPILPGQTFPLNVQHFERTEMLKSCKERDRTFGVLAISDDKKKVNVYGTTAEIYEYADEARWIAIKAKARQRFKLLNPKKYNLEADIRMAEVLILPEVQLQHPFDAVNSPAFNALRVHGKERQRRYQSSFFPWPKWVYDMYDSEKLVQQANKLTFLKQGLRKERGAENLMPQEPTELSFWIANHLDPDQKLFVLKINSPIPRLRWLLSFISKIQRYVCANCDVFIAKPEDIFAMSAEGAQNTYVNSEGFHHDTITLMKADSVIPISSPSTHFSWFPGYAWSIAVCQCCQKHLGWQFIANKKDLWPKKFWGITRKSLQTRIGGPYDFGEQPVM